MAVDKEVKTAITSHDYIVDLSAIEEFDSSAIAAALNWVRVAQSEGNQLQLINVPETFWKLADLYRIRHFLDVSIANR
ncbi:MAG: STAS domain-containing protein [Burkholderiales bacterium]|nr:STAS domain-containing protein [Burkholderiales bacterium]